jgi:hypothetical protein
MALYFFHLVDGADLLLDPDGREIDEGSLQAVAISEARAMIAADARAGHIRLDQHIDVHDSSETTVCSVQFEDAVTITHLAVRDR